MDSSADEPPADGLDERQRALVGEWLPGARLVRDHSPGGLIDTAMLEFEVAAREVAVVATHGDWRPRNWLVDDASGRPVVGIIDFGSAALRPAMNDFARPARQDFARDHRLEVAFLERYGSDPRMGDEELWRMIRLREALSTAAWAFHVGDEDFETQGHCWLARFFPE